MNRKRLALSAFVVGAIVCPTALHRWGDLHKAVFAFDTARTLQCLAEREAANPATVPTPHALPDRAPPTPFKSNADDSALGPLRPYDGPYDVCYAPSIDSYHKGFVAAAPVLSPWLLAVVIGGISAAIVGYLLPTICAIVFRGIPRFVVAYVRWLNGPDA